ncbi:MAG: N-acetylmuramoyl-L-alanine amidase [Lachnospiraceae bacterium]|nr:N-acetylmuramoyl-L-alanine amidase [Lachnospiraceae bacterium]
MIRGFLEKHALCCIMIAGFLLMGGILLAGYGLSLKTQEDFSNLPEATTEQDENTTLESMKEESGKGTFEGNQEEDFISSYPEELQEQMKEILTPKDPFYAGDSLIFLDETLPEEAYASYKTNEDLEKRDKPLVIIDPGHGGADTGAISRYGGYEKNHALEICRLVRIYLNEYDVDVQLTRTSDIFINRYDRIIYANANRADVFVSVHRNSNPSRYPSGVSIYVGYLEEEKDRPLAQSIMDRIQEVPGTGMDYVRGNCVIAGSCNDYDIDYVLNRFSLMPGCLIELGYMSNYYDNQHYYQNKREYAKAIAEGIVAYLREAGYSVSEVEE